MTRITIHIDAKPRHCGECVFRSNGWCLSESCVWFTDKDGDPTPLEFDHGENDWRRLRRCLRAEVRKERKP